MFNLDRDTPWLLLELISDIDPSNMIVEKGLDPTNTLLYVAGQTLYCHNTRKGYHIVRDL